MSYGLMVGTLEPFQLKKICKIRGQKSKDITYFVIIDKV